MSLGLCDVLYRALGRFSLDESVTAACYMALSAMLSSDLGPHPGMGGDEEEKERKERKDGVEEKEDPDSESGLVVCPLSSPVRPSHSSSLSSGEARGVEEVAMASAVSAIMRRLSSLGLGPLCVETLRHYPSSRQVDYRSFLSWFPHLI